MLDQPSLWQPSTWGLSRSQAAFTAIATVPLIWWRINAWTDRKPRHAGPTDFNHFLKVPAATHTAPTARLATDFDSFLIDSSTGDDVADRMLQNQQGKDSGPPLTEDSIVVTILFGTEYGFSKEIAEKLRDAIWAQPPLWPQLLDMADHPEGLDLSKEQALLIVCSTQGDGVPPAEARGFCDWLDSSALQDGALSEVSFSVCALGDRSYEHFCACGTSLESRLVALGGKCFVPRTDVNREDWPAIDGWLDSVVAGLQNLDMHPASQTGHSVKAPGDVDASRAPRWAKSRPYPGRVLAIEGLCHLESNADKDTIRVEIDLGDSGLVYLPGDALGIYPSNRPMDADVLMAVMGAPCDVTVPQPGWPYRQGPSGAADDGPMMLRDALISAYDIRSPKPELLQLIARSLPPPLTNGHSNGQPNGLVNGHSNGLANGLVNGHSKEHSNGLIRDASEGVANDHSKSVSHSAGSISDQAARLQKLMAGGSEAYLSQRHVADILADFPAAHVAPLEVVAALRQLQPRLYSISSSQLEGCSRVAVTVAVVRYEALGRSRVGVTSTLLSDRLQVGDTVPVFVSRNPDFRLPEDKRVGVIMVGPGTGLAPFRAFMLHRLLTHRPPPHGSVALVEADPVAAALQQEGLVDQIAVDARSSSPDLQVAEESEAAMSTVGEKPSGAAKAEVRRIEETHSDQEEDADDDEIGPAMLFFGCRRPDRDFLYSDLLQKWHESGKLELHTAFSRHQAEKVYVQHRVREAGARVWELLEGGAHVYICGDAGAMAPDVHEALLDVICTHQGLGRQAAEVYIETLTKHHRYQRDVWMT